jgi:hypothetical protein
MPTQSLRSFVTKTEAELALYETFLAVVPDLRCYETSHVKPAMNPGIYRFSSPSVNDRADTFSFDLDDTEGGYQGWQSSIRQMQGLQKLIIVKPVFQAHPRCYVSCEPEKFVVGRLVLDEGIFFDFDFESEMKAAGFTVTLIEKIRKAIQVRQVEMEEEHKRREHMVQNLWPRELFANLKPVKESHANSSVGAPEAPTETRERTTSGAGTQI